MTTRRQAGGKPFLRARVRPLLAAVVAGILAVVLLVTVERVWHRRWEAEHRVLAIVEITAETTDPLVWGRNFPAHLRDYLRSKASQGAWGGRAARRVESETWQTLLGGYRPGRHYTGKRGHTYAEDNPGAADSPSRIGSTARCLECHDRGMPDYRAAGRALGIPDALYEEQAMKGFESLEAAPYGRGMEQAATPVWCIDCHTPGSLALRVSRPEFLDAIRALAQSQAPVPPLPSIARWRRGDRASEYSPQAVASRQEMRILVCAQCHAGYHLDADTATVAFPWRSGTGVESLEAHLDDGSTADWTHSETGARLVKARQPQFEIWSQGRHAEQGVSCTDCHMPYRRDGALKITDHHLRSPRLNPARACGPCHLTGEAELLALVQRTQQRTSDLMLRAERSLAALLTAAERARRAGVPETELDAIRRWHRRAQWRLDLVMADSSLGFHAPAETLRILAEAIDFARQGEGEALERLLDGREGAAQPAAVLSSPQETG